MTAGRIILSLVIFASLVCSAAGDEAPAAIAEGLRELSLVAVEHGGRVKPLSVMADEVLSRIETPSREAGRREQDRLLAYLTGYGQAVSSPSFPAFREAGIYPAEGRWRSLSEISRDSSPTADEMRFTALAEGLLTLAREGGEGFNESAAQLHEFLAARYDAYGADASRLRAEVALNRLRPFVVCMLLYVVAGAAAWVFVARGMPRWLVALPVVAAFLLNVASTGFYGYVAGRIPVNNSYEGLLVFAASLGAFAVISLFTARGRPGAVMGSLLAAGVLSMSEYLPISRGITPPMPALQSLWLQFHVLTCFVGYAAFALSFAASVVILVSRNSDRRRDFDSISYRAVLVGFIFLSVGILTGAAWAKQAWGRYWGFDPKETWALVTWLVYAVYLHLALLGRKREVLRALASIVGFIVVMFTFLGVNYLLSGLHSYG